MKLNRLILLFFVIGIIFVSSCNEEEEGINKRDILTSSDWAISSMTGSGSAFLISRNFNGLEEMPACSRDDLFNFEDDNTYEVLENEIECTAGNAIVSTGNWQFKDDENVLQIDSDYLKQILEDTDLADFNIDDIFPDGTIDFQIQEFTASQIKLFMEDKVKVTIPDFQNPVDVNVEVNITLVPEEEG